MRVLGYVTSRSFQGLTIPVPAQNSCLREFAKAQKLVYVLPPLEHYFQNCYMQLFTVLKSMQDGDILAMYSAAMLPTNKKKLEFIFSELKYLDAKCTSCLNLKTVKNLEEVKSFIFLFFKKYV